MKNDFNLGIQFVETDPKKILNDLISSYEEFSKRKLYPADPMRLHLAWEADIISQERVNINNTANQNILKYARENNLDNLAEMFRDAERLEAESATTTFEFKLSTSISSETIINKGTRVGVDGEIIFATTNDLIIKAGEQTGTVEGVCLTKGNIGNGFLAGQIAQAVDVFPYFESVQNITESAGGAERETDSAFYERIVNSAKAYSTAGPSGAYEYFAKSASVLIKDVKAISERPGETDIRILLKDGKLPTSEIIKKVSDFLNDEKRRPLTDKVNVLAPDVENYEIDLTYYIQDGDSLNDVKTNVNSAVEKYKRWQSEKMGRDVNPSYLTALLIEAGVKRVDIRKPVYKEVNEKTVAILIEAGEKVNNGGFESE